MISYDVCLSLSMIISRSIPVATSNFVLCLQWWGAEGGREELKSSILSKVLRL